MAQEDSLPVLKLSTGWVAVSLTGTALSHAGTCVRSF